MSALPGIASWSVPRGDQRRAYEAPTCTRDLSRKYADTITVFQVRHILARMIDPKHIISGWMPRRVCVVDAAGNVVREITGEQLGAKLIARGAVEFAVNGALFPSTVCLKCGGNKKNKLASACRSCAGFAPKADKYTCPKCGGPRSKFAKGCRACAGLAPKPERFICPGCGGRRAEGAKRCLACAGRALVAPGSVTCACGRPKAKKSTTCQACRAEAKASLFVCACGGAKSRAAKLCAACFASQGGWGAAC